MLKRDDYVYKNVKCSEPLYDHKFMKKIAKKDEGILHFSKSLVERGDDDRYTSKVKEYGDNTLPCHCRNPQRFVQDEKKTDKNDNI